MRSTDDGVDGDETARTEPSGGKSALVAVGAAAARAETHLPTALRRSLARRFLVALVGFVVVVPAAALALPTAAASVGAVVAAGVLLGAVGFCELYYVLVGTERRLAALRAGETEPKPGACVRLDEGGALVDAVETTVDDYERRLADAATERERLAERNAALEREVTAWSDEARGTLKAVGDGDLDRRLDAGDAPGPLAAVSAALDDALEELEETFFNVESFATEADRAGIEATEAGDAVADRADAVADRADTVAERLDRQQRDVERAAGTAADLSAGFEDLEAAADDAASGLESVEDAVDAAAETAASADGALAAASTDRARAEAERARARAGDVGHHLDAVEDLADRVGLLALNATLHAARAEARGVAGAERFRTLAGGRASSPRRPTSGPRRAGTHSPTSGRGPTQSARRSR